MPKAPSTLDILHSAREDIRAIQAHNPDHAERILKKIHDWQDKIQWGRVPQRHLKYLTGSENYSFYRDRVGNSGYRIIYEISGDLMTVVGVAPKSDDTYDLEEFRRRMNRRE